MRHQSLVLVATALLLGAGCAKNEPVVGHTLSLTGEGFTGHKYYLGWGDHLSGEMGNETRYDVRHTHDIFTTGAGGDYDSTTLIDRDVDGGDIENAWEAIGHKITADDMYVQYSSGHGYEQGLGAGVTYDQIRDNALGYPAKEVVIFTMACHSGGLVDAFNQKQSVWRDWQAQGRSLFVMSSSREDQLSSTGPGTDRDEPNGPDGSAGSAFGHALWKALIGYADGYVDGVKDGFISLGEIDAFVKMKTREVGGHDPVVTGAFNPNTIMNRVPPPRYQEEVP